MDLTIIKAVISTLDCIEVKGRDNLDALLGCINALESFVQIAEIQEENKPTEQEEVNG